MVLSAKAIQECSIRSSIPEATCRSTMMPSARRCFLFGDAKETPRRPPSRSSMSSPMIGSAASSSSGRWPKASPLSTALSGRVFASRRSSFTTMSGRRMRCGTAPWTRSHALSAFQDRPTAPVSCREPSKWSQGDPVLQAGTRPAWRERVAAPAKRKSHLEASGLAA